MASILEYLNYKYQSGSVLIRLIMINLGVFAFLAIINVFGTISGLGSFVLFINEQFSIPADFSEFIFRPWTIITYAFSHSLNDIFHILFNMLVMYWFGQFIVNYMGQSKLFPLYIQGAVAGALLYLLAYNLIPFYIAQSTGVHMVGASAAVNAIVVAAAVLLPNHSLNLLFLGSVKLKYIAAFYVVTSFLGTVGGNAGGNIAHLGGAFWGWFFIKQYQKGKDYALPFNRFVDILMGIFKSRPKKPKIKVVHKRPVTDVDFNTQKVDNQEQLDKILDKISKSGYDSLSKFEKTIFN